MYIRDFNTNDFSQVKNLLINIYGQDTSSINYFNFGNFNNALKTFVVIEKNKIIGIASLWENKFHKDSMYIGIHILKDFRYNGLGTNLFFKLLKFNNTKQYQCALWSYNTTGLRFAKKLGFTILRKTYEPIYNLSLNYKFNTINTLDFSYSIQPLALLKKNYSNIINLFKEIYIRNHQFNKIANLSDAQWTNIIFTDLNLNTSFAIFKDNILIAISLMYHGDNNLTLELGLRGVKNDFLFFEESLILNLLNHQFDTCKKLNYLFIKDEIDSTDSGAMVASQFINLNKYSSWITLVR